MGNFAEIKNKLKSLMSGSTEFVGLDIGSHSVKAVCVSGYEKHFRLKSWGISPLAIKPEADPEEKKFLTSVAIKEMLSKSGINNKYVALSVSGNSVIVRYVTLPKTDKANLRLVLASEAEPFIPFDIKDVNLSAHIIGDKNEEGQKKMEIVLVAAKKDLLRNRMDILTAAGLTPLIIDVDAFTLETVYEHLPSFSPADTHGVLILNIGHRVTNLTILEKGVTRVARDIFIAGNAFNRALIKNMEIENEKADALKRQYGVRAEGAPLDFLAAATEEDKVHAVTEEVLRDLVSEVKRSVDFYFSQGADRTIGKVCLAGGGANMKNLPAFLSAELKVPVEILNPLAVCSASSAEPVPPELASSLSVAVGLALRKMWDWE